MQILTRTRRCVRMAKMQGAEAEGAGSVLKYMTKPECRQQRSRMAIMTHRLPDGTGIQKTLQSPTFSYRILHLPYGKSKDNSIKHALSYTFFMYPTPYPTPNPSPEIVSKYRASCAFVQEMQDMFIKLFLWGREPETKNIGLLCTKHPYFHVKTSALSLKEVRCF